MRSSTYEFACQYLSIFVIFHQVDAVCAFPITRRSPLERLERSIDNLVAGLAWRTTSVLTYFLVTVLWLQEIPSICSATFQIDQQDYLFLVFQAMPSLNRSSACGRPQLNIRISRIDLGRSILGQIGTQALWNRPSYTYGTSE